MKKLFDADKYEAYLAAQWQRQEEYGAFLQDHQVGEELPRTTLHSARTSSYEEHTLTFETYSSGELHMEDVQQEQYVIGLSGKDASSVSNCGIICQRTSIFVLSSLRMASPLDHMRCIIRQHSSS